MMEHSEDNHVDQPALTDDALDTTPESAAVARAEELAEEEAETAAEAAEEELEEERTLALCSSFLLRLESFVCPVHEASFSRSSVMWSACVGPFHTAAADLPRPLRRAGGTRTPNPRFWRPVLCQIELRPSAVGESPAARTRPVYGPL